MTGLVAVPETPCWHPAATGLKAPSARAGVTQESIFLLSSSSIPQTPSLEVFKAKLDVALGNLV